MTSHSRGMTVRELIQQLSQFDDDTPVVIDAGRTASPQAVTAVMNPVMFSGQGRVSDEPHYGSAAVVVAKLEA